MIVNQVLLDEVAKLLEDLKWLDENEVSVLWIKNHKLYENNWKNIRNDIFKFTNDYKQRTSPSFYTGVISGGDNYALARDRKEDTQKHLNTLTRIYNQMQQKLSEQSTNITQSHKPTTKNICIVYGHDKIMKLEAINFVHTIGYFPKHLDIEPAGYFILADFEELAKDCCFAICLFTPDDFDIRARQNVVFEAGYFTSLLGTKKIALIKKENTEILSDLNGIKYIPYDDMGAWKIKIADQMNKAELSVDKNHIKI